MSKEQNGDLQEAIKLVEEAQSKKVFNLSDAIKGRSYPKKDVTIYLDDESAMRVMDLNQKMNETIDPEELSDLEDEARELSQKIKDGALIFSMRGVNQKTVEEVMTLCNEKYKIAKDDDPTINIDWLKDYITILVGLNIEKVTDGHGNVDNTKFGFEETNELRTNLPSIEWDRLVDAMQKLTLAGGYFDQLTDAGFLQKS